MNVNNLTPEQHDGAATDVTEMIALTDQLKADKYYLIATKRLLRVYEWDKLCKLPSSEFRLINSKGVNVKRLATVGDYFRIDLPAPGNAAGDGFDWVRIEAIEETKPESDPAFTAMRVRPCSNPFEKNNTTAHFFEAQATSTFIVRKEGKKLFAEVHGRNEVSNTDTGQFFNNIRNVLIAWGAALGFSFPQWKSLAAGILNFENEK